MHILHLVQLYAPAPSGAARYFIEIGERLVRDGHRVTVLATDAFDLEHLWMAGRRRVAEPEDWHNGVRVLRFPVRRIPGSPLIYPVNRRLMVELGRISGTTPLLRRMARLTPHLPALARYLAESPDLADVALVHTTNITLDFAILPMQAWAQRRNIPHICTPFVHLGEPENRQVRRYYSMPHQIALLRRSAAVITQTDLERRFLQDAGVPNHLLHTIGCGVTPSDLAGGDAERFRQEYNLTGPIVLTMGTAAYDKGTIHVLQAMQQLWAAGREATWVQIGATMQHFDQFYSGLPAKDRARTRVLGFVSDQVRRDALAAASVLTLPSRTDSFGLVYLEAWCYAVPVVGAWAGGVPDVVSHGVNGLLVRFGDVSALASSIDRLLNDRALAQAMGQAGQSRVVRSMTWDHVYARMQTLLLDLNEKAVGVGSS
jgi:glycosyltransferase involved in cell wall biosynthesis